ncbi:PREDICTED: TBC1 domain family member 10A-like [Acropora digitifera]|uniref:TBC1 domain family member 10A-like n=1 Tax=Acropora digitifera TaxID=70779 RepID=UPI00077A2BF1|nr:PREDICTED: TBC1 domain family member 10A-like [Acropora digitifera]
MEFYEPSSVQLHGVTRFDPDLSPALLPNVDRYGFVGNHKQASESSQTVDVDVFRHREIKWLEMLQNWDKWINKKFPKVKERCRKGIPSSVRGRAWQKLSGSFTLLNQNPGLFDVSLCPDIFSTKYQEAVKLDGAIFGGLLETTVPHIAKHMKTHHVDPLLYMTEWFMCLLARNLPFATVLRVWDMFFCEGIKVLFRTTLAMMKLVLTPKDLSHCKGWVHSLPFAHMYFMAKKNCTC